jgi:hypothetical protein
LHKANIEVGNVNNTSDINKPISNAKRAINVLRLEVILNTYKRALLTIG